MIPRDAGQDEAGPLARLWHEGWHDAHDGVVPDPIVQLRTLAEMQARMPGYVPHTRVIGPPGAPLGMVILRGDELYQFYVARAARGTGLAAALLADAEAQIAGQGHRVAWLACAIGNDRAAHFYGKHGWQRVGEEDFLLETLEAGPMPLRVWRYEKALAAP